MLSSAGPVANAAGHTKRIGVFAVLLTYPIVALAAAMPGAPAAAPFATPSDGAPLLRVLFALLLVLGAVYAAAKLSRRMGISAGAPSQRLEIVAQTALGPRERAVLLRIGDRQVLLGVATGNVRLLVDLQDRVDLAGSTAPESPASPAASAHSPVPPSFRALLLRSLGR